MEPLIPVHWDDKQPRPDPDRVPLDPRTARSLFALGVGTFVLALLGVAALIAAEIWLGSFRFGDATRRSRWHDVPTAVVIAAFGAWLLVVARKRARRRLPWVVPAILGLAAIAVAIARVAMGDSQPD